MSKTYNVLLLADQQSGNEMGLLHPQMPGFNFGNSWQEYAWECWKHMKSKLPKRIDVTVSMDEALDGPAKPNTKYRTQITKPSAQRLNAKKLLQPIRDRSEKFFMVAGSNWHVDELGESTLVLAEEVPDGVTTREVCKRCGWPATKGNMARAYNHINDLIELDLWEYAGKKEVSSVIGAKIFSPAYRPKRGGEEGI